MPRRFSLFSLSLSLSGQLAQLYSAATRWVTARTTCIRWPIYAGPKTTPQWTSLKSPWRNMATCSRREPRRPGRNGRRLTFYVLAEPPVRAKMLTAAAVLCRCRPRYRAGYGRRARRAWALSDLTPVANEGHGAAGWRARTSARRRPDERRRQYWQMTNDDNICKKIVQLSPLPVSKRSNIQTGVHALTVTKTQQCLVLLVVVTILAFAVTL